MCKNGCLIEVDLLCCHDRRRHDVDKEGERVRTGRCTRIESSMRNCRVNGVSCEKKIRNNIEERSEDNV